MRFIRQIPRALRLVAGLMFIGIIGLLTWAAMSAQGKTGYEFAKDVVIPLFSPMVAIFVPTILFYVIPMTQNQQKGALDLFNAFSNEEMRQARNATWVYFIIELRYMPPSEQAARLDDFLRHLFEADWKNTTEAAIHETYQKASRVLDFFAIVNTCVRKKTVDRGMVRSFLAYYYLLWRDGIMDPLRTRPLPLEGKPRYKPVWWDELKALDELCKPEG